VNIFFQIYNFSDCSTSTSCAFYFSYVNNTFSKPPVLQYTWNLTVNPGFNRILFNTSYDIKKGSIVFLNQGGNYTGAIALETLGNATYSDMKWGINLTSYYDTQINGNLTNISGIKYINYRFYLNVITQLEYYQNSFNFVHLYDESFLFNVSAYPLSAASPVYFNRKVLIDRKYLFKFYFSIYF